MAVDEILEDLRAAASRRDHAIAAFTEKVIQAFEAGYPQREIARVLGVTQPAVSQMIASERARRMSAHGPIGSRLATRKAEVLSIAAAHGARHPRVFGSVAEGRDTPASDLDLLVTLPRTAGMLAVAALGDELADALGVPVDVVAEHMVKPGELAALKRRSIVL